MPDWSESIEPEHERSLFWHWIWLESGKPTMGVDYDVMMRPSHRYHYAVEKYPETKIGRKHDQD